jgi:hypothetical protein
MTLGMKKNISYYGEDNWNQYALLISSLQGADMKEAKEKTATADHMMLNR